MESLISELNSRNYGIVFTEDYLKLIQILIKDLARRKISPTGSYIEYLGNDKINKTNVINYIVMNMTKIGYKKNESFGIVDAEQMKRLRASLVDFSKKVVNTTKGIAQKYIVSSFKLDIGTLDVGNGVGFANSEWTILHKIDNGTNDRYIIIRRNSPVNLQYHNVSHGQWSTSNIRSYLENTFYQSIPQNDRKKIVSVINHTSVGKDNYSSGVETSRDMVWLESYTNIMGTSWVGTNTGAVSCNEYTEIDGVAIKTKFRYYTVKNGQIGTGKKRRLRSTGGTAWNMACPASGTSINVGNHGDFFGTTEVGACYPCVCVRY